MVLAAQSGGLFTGGGSSHEGTQRFSQLMSQLPCGQNFQSQKTFGKIFQIFVSKVFGGLPWRLAHNLTQSQKTHILRFKVSFFLIFQFSLEHFVTIHYHPHLNFSQTHRVILRKPPFLYHFNFKSSSKRYGFSLSHYIFHVFELYFLEFVSCFQYQVSWGFDHGLDYFC